MCPFLCVYGCVCECVSYLFNGEVIDQMMVVFIEAAVQRHTIRVKEQVLWRDPRKKKPNKIPDQKSQ